MESKIYLNNIFTKHVKVIDRTAKYYNKYPLHASIYHGEGIDKVKLIIEQGYDVNTPTYVYNMTALHYAVYCNNFDMVKFLVEKCNANVNAFDCYDFNLFIYAFLGKHNNIKMLEYLISKNMSIYCTNKYNESLMHMVSDTKHDTTELIKLLMKHNLSINHRNIYGQTPIMMAIYNGNITLINTFINLGADTHVKCTNDYTLLHMQKPGKNTIKITKLLLSLGLDINAAGTDGVTPLHVLCKSLHTPTVDHIKFFIDNGANVNAIDENKNTPMHNYLKLSNNYVSKKIVKTFINAGVDLSIINNENNNVLSQYVIGNYYISLNILKMFCSKTFDPCYTYSLSRTTILSNLIHTELKCIRYWLKKFPNTVNVSNHDGNYPIHFAANKYNSDIVKLLIKFGANVNARDGKGYTPLHRAVTVDVDRIKLLIDNGATFTYSAGGVSVLMNALYTCASDFTVIKHLITCYKQDVSYTTNNGENAMSICIKRNYTEMFDYILSQKPTLKSILTAIETVYKYCNLKGKNKYAIKRLVMEYFPDFHTNFSLYKNNKECKEYIDNCLKEIETLKETKVSNCYNLFDIVKNKDYNIIDDTDIEKYKVLTSLEIYGSFVQTVLEMSKLLKKTK
ncbi:ankyrin repeat protein [Hypsugopox virus]|nr:ankyrin repeat protein [Hypsugopox virus]